MLNSENTKFTSLPTIPSLFGVNSRAQWACPMDHGPRRVLPRASAVVLLAVARVATECLGRAVIRNAAPRGLHRMVITYKKGMWSRHLVLHTRITCCYWYSVPIRICRLSTLFYTYASRKTVMNEFCMETGLLINEMQ